MPALRPLGPPSTSPSDSARSGGRSRLADLFVWGTFALLLANAIRFVAQYGPRVMLMDDLSVGLTEVVPRGLTFANFWNFHNEHRIPVPRAIQYALYQATGDIRSGMYFSVALLAAIAAATIVAARRLRGRASWTDAVFAVVWLQTGNCENLLMGFQLSLILPTALVCAIVLNGILDPRPSSSRSALLSGLALLVLPLCGGPGMLQAPALGAWLVLCGVDAWRHPGEHVRERRRVAWILWSFTAATVVVMVLYVQGFRSSSAEHGFGGFAGVGRTALTALALAIGPAAETWWPWSGIGVLALAVSALALAARAWMQRAERARALGIAAAVAATLSLALGIGLGRSWMNPEGSFPIRYVGLATPIVGTAYFAWHLHGPRRLASIVNAGMCAASMLAFALVGWSYGERTGAKKHDTAVALERDLERGAPPAQILWKYTRFVEPDVRRMAYAYGLFAELRKPPFDRAAESTRLGFLRQEFDPEPANVTGDVEPAPADARGERGWWMQPGSGVSCFVPADARRVTLRCAVPDDRGALRFVAATLTAGTFWGRRIVFDRELDGDGGSAAPVEVSFELPPDCGFVNLRVVAPLDGRPAAARGWWSRMRFE